MPQVLTVPGDKSITHRVLMIAALSQGSSRIGGALTALDARSTARVLRQLGAGISPLREGAMVTVKGVSRFSAPPIPLDCGNSGTAARLLLGLLAGHPFGATVTGDRSLRGRPMRRVTDPLAAMGATIAGADSGDRLPLTIQGGNLRPLRYAMPVASAQVKSALLLAGLSGRVPVAVREGVGGTSRDHTERLLAAFGFALPVRDGWIEFDPSSGYLEPFSTEIPGDPSSAAFLLAAAMLGRAPRRLRISGVALNPTRTGFLAVIRRMGALVETEQLGTVLGEPIGDLVLTPGDLQATDIPASEVPGVIDEIPVLAALAARCLGTTIFHQVGELRVKESDRLGLLTTNLQGLGVEAVAEGDTLRVTGTRGPLKGRIRTADDHRLAMAFGVLGASPRVDLVVDNPDCAGVSFPGFWKVLSSLRGR